MKIKIRGVTLKKESISKLQESQMSQFRGGNQLSDSSCHFDSCPPSCNQNSCTSEELELD